jgi:hypothetical protein
MHEHKMVDGLVVYLTTLYHWNGLFNVEWQDAYVYK